MHFLQGKARADIPQDLITSQAAGLQLKKEPEINQTRTIFAPSAFSRSSIRS
jgi:hypothetical protein